MIPQQYTKEISKMQVDIGIRFPKTKIVRIMRREYNHPMGKRWLRADMVVGILAGVMNGKAGGEQGIIFQGPGQQEAVWLILPEK